MLFLEVEFPKYYKIYLDLGHKLYGCQIIKKGWFLRFRIKRAKHKLIKTFLFQGGHFSY